MKRREYGVNLDDGVALSTAEEFRLLYVPCNPDETDRLQEWFADDTQEPRLLESKIGTGKFLCEPKRASEVSDEVVQSKADAAAVWCEHATVHAKTYGGKPWVYLLIPHDQISEQMSLSGLAARCTHTSRGQGTGGKGKE